MNDDYLIRLAPGAVRKLHKRLLKVKEESLPSGDKLGVTKENTIPSPRHLEKIIIDMLLVSGKPEEGRFPQFKVAFGPPFGLDAHALIFHQPKLWCVEELVKLSPAITQPDGHIGVWTYGRDLLLIWGIQTNSHIQTTFEIVDPGRLTVSFPISSKVAELTGQRLGFISDVWNNQGLRLMSGHASDADTSWMSALIEFFYGIAMREVLRRIRSLKHGGSLIIVPDNQEWQKSVVQPVFYSCQQKLNQIEPIATSLRQRMLNIETDSSVESDLKMKVGMELLADLRLNVFLWDAARNIAFLSSVDGATVLTSKFEVIGFGAKIKMPKSGGRSRKVTELFPLESDVIPHEVSVNQAFRGTRHASAANFAFDNPGSRVFVVSQDGGITGFEKVDLDEDHPSARLLAYRGLELLI